MTLYHICGKLRVIPISCLRHDGSDKQQARRDCLPKHAALLLLLLKTTQRRGTQALAIIYELWALARTS